MMTLKTKDRIACEILHFADGDTVHVRVHCPTCGCSQMRYVRLKGIESFELRGFDSERAHAIAKKYSELYLKKEAELLATQSSSDRYGRIVGHIYIDGKDLAQTLVEAGDAWYHNHKTKRQ